MAIAAQQNFWPDIRVEHLRGQIRRLAREPEICFSFSPSRETGRLNYFPKDICDDLAACGHPRFRHVVSSGDGQKPHLVILTAHGSDLSNDIWEIRTELGPDVLIAVWFWDNHLGHLTNLRTALAADLLFFSHSEDQGYLFSPNALVAAHVPACSAQWTKQEAGDFFGEAVQQDRKSRLLVNYVDYAFTSRGEIIRRLERDVAQADVLTMPSGDRSRYFGKSARERFQEWAAYKATIILPVTNDLSTRFFDAMLAGMVPIVLDCVWDLDRVVPPATQREIGIVRVESYDSDSLRAATSAAIAAFDELGMPGVLARHAFVRDNHMLANRIDAMLNVVSMLMDGRLEIEFGGGMHGVGLYPVDSA